jgi:IclR family transcriptional regulator, KDG regulon repressor
MQILGLFAVDRMRLGITEISEALGLHRATVQGLVRTLAQEGFLQQDKETRKYELGLKVFELGTIRARGLEINHKSSAPAYQLAKKIHRLVRIGILDDTSVLVTLDVYPRAVPLFSHQLAARAPLYCTGLGKAMLAFFPEEQINTYFRRVELKAYTGNTITDKARLLEELEGTRKRGYSLNREEHVWARASIGAPIFGGEGQPNAAICVIVEPSCLNSAQVEGLAADVMTTAHDISRLLGFSPKPMHRL